jgi:hypothetical protein
VNSHPNFFFLKSLKYTLSPYPTPLVVLVNPPANICRPSPLLLCLCRHPWCVVFGDEKPLKGEELFNCWGCADPLAGLVEDFVVDLDWRNTYAITGLCRIRRGRPPFSYIVNDGSNNVAVFCDFVGHNLLSGFLQPGDFLVLDNALIHHFQEATGLDSYLWSYHGMFLQFLPMHSPELNPIKLLWNTLMQRLKHFPLSDDYGPRTHRVACAAEILMSEFTHEDVDACYCHCSYI